MDDTGASLEVSKAATATRKRRSSILKNQRPPRTPFSELEFNVATPTDTAKSRRVSFSKRTGVAEFVRNEATTTWKNFYEEHNKSLETSVNDSAAPRQVIEHIGKRIFDQQFEEIEVVDIGGTLQSNTGDCQNNVNLSLDSTNKLTGPTQNFELSLMTDHQTKVFGEEFSVPTMNEMSNPININFSNLNIIGDKCDDLEEMERDLERSKNVVCPGPFNGRDMSEYIEIDLNMTHMVGQIDQNDMSITEPIKSPNIQAVSRSENFGNDKKTNEDWTMDKENIIINPYVTPKESLNFASNDTDDKILVFDGKKLTVQSDRQPIPDVDEKNKYFNLLPNATDTTPQRKTIFLNTNDDLPNFVQDSVTSVNNEGNLKKNTMYSDCDLSITQAITNNIDTQKRKTIVFDEGADVSITQAIPSKVIINKQKRNTIIYENDNDNNISIAQAITNNIDTQKRKTIVFDEGADVSITQAIPSKVIINKQKRNTIIYENDNDNNISITQAIRNNIDTQKRKTIVFDEGADVSITQGIPSKVIINKQKRNTIIYDNDNDNNISITQAITNNIDTQKRKTIVFDEGADVSITQAIPSKVIINKQKRNTIIYDNDNDNNISIAQAITNNIDTQKRKTIVFDEGADVSITQAIPSKVIINKQKRNTIIYENDNDNNISIAQAITNNIDTQKRKTIVFDEGADVSITQAIPSKVIINKQKRNTIIYENDNDNNISITQAIRNNIDTQKRKTIVFDEGADVSITQGIPSKVIINKQKRNTIIYDNDNDNNISITQTVRTNIINNKNDKRRTIVYEDDNISFTQAIPANLIMNNENKTVQNKTLLYQNDNDISITQEIPENIINNEIDNDDNISMTQAIPSNIIMNTQTVYDNNEVKNIKETNEFDKSRTVHENNLSFTQAISNVMLDEVKNKMESSKTQKRVTIYDNDISMTQAMPSNIIQSLAKSETVNIINNECEITPLFPTNFLVDINKKHIDPTINNSLLENNIDKITNAIKAETLQDSYTGNVSNLSMTKPIPSNIIDLQNDILKKNSKNPNKNVLPKDNNREVLVYQTNQTITISKLKEIEEQNIDAIVDQNNFGLVEHVAVEEISKPINNTEINVEVNKEEYKTEIDEVKTESLDVTKKSDVSKGNLKKSILNELLDMSCSSLEDVVDDEIKIRSYKLTNEMKVSFKTDSSEMIKDEKVSNTSETPECSENNELIENREMSVENDLILKILSKPPAVDYKEDSENAHSHNEVDKNIEKEEKRVSNNRHYETIISSELQQSLDNLNTSPNNKKSSLKGNKSFKNADDTNELLEMLSDFTDGHTEEEEKPIPIEIKGHLAIENKIEPKRLSFAPNRLSIVMSREEMLNNISMAHAALQQSRFEIDDDSIEETLESPEYVTETESPTKSVRMSTEVVKTLQFEEDESLDDISTKSEINYSPLKKTAFGETSYMKDSRAKVIPTYLKDVSDNIKALMSDLVKPIDVMPFETGNFDKSLRKSPSTCSTQIQANLLTSSQIDIDTELQSKEGSLYSVKPSEIMTKEIASMGNKAIAEALRQSMKPISANASIEAHIERAPDFEKSIRKSKNGPVLVFDQSNPLNNVLLSQPDYTKVHKYNPIISTDAMDTEYGSSTHDKTDKYEVERVSTCYNVESKNQSALQSGDTCPDITNKNSLISNLSKPLSIDKSTDGIGLAVKDREMNTLIAMKETKEILATNSSLTLVDDALARSVFDVDIESSSVSTDNKQSPVRVIYQMEHEDDSLQKMDSDFTSIDDLETDENMKSKKRIYSPTKLDKNKTIAPNVEVTPKPVSKIQKMSKSPQINEIVSPEKMEVIKSPKHKISPEKLKSKSITVQKLLTKRQQDYRDKTLTKKILEAVDTSSILDIDTISQTICGLSSLDVVGSYTSSRCTKEMQDGSSADSQAISAVGSNISKMNWQPEFVNEPSSKNLIEECSSSANVVAKIDTLPFMGTRDCEWESSTGDVWIFRLLRSRIRIIIRLAHTHHNASRSRVRADTAILSLAVEPVEQEERDPLARLAVGLASRAMRHSAHKARAGAGPAPCSAAGGVPALLVRCWSLTRLALRWARTLRDARARLALCFEDDGNVALKVANIPLRSVWEVRLRVELVAEEGEEAWPRATEPRAVAVLADDAAAPALDRLVRTLPHDWGHAPAAIWKIFKYLKNKTRDDDILSL